MLELSPSLFIVHQPDRRNRHHFRLIINKVFETNGEAREASKEILRALEYYYNHEKL